LKDGVVSVGTSCEKAHRQPVQGQASRERVATDYYRDLPFLLESDVGFLITHAVADDQDRLFNNGFEDPFDLGEWQCLGAVFQFRPVDRGNFSLPECHPGVEITIADLLCEA